jgi:hypothetical protein
VAPQLLDENAIINAETESIDSFGSAEEGAFGNTLSRWNCWKFIPICSSPTAREELSANKNCISIVYYCLINREFNWGAF